MVYLQNELQQWVSTLNMQRVSINQRVKYLYQVSGRMNKENEPQFLEKHKIANEYPVMHSFFPCRVIFLFGKSGMARSKSVHM